MHVELQRWLSRSQTPAAHARTRVVESWGREGELTDRLRCQEHFGGKKTFQSRPINYARLLEPYW